MLGTPFARFRSVVLSFALFDVFSFTARSPTYNNYDPNRIRTDFIDNNNVIYIFLRAFRCCCCKKSHPHSFNVNSNSPNSSNKRNGQTRLK